MIKQAVKRAFNILGMDVRSYHSLLYEATRLTTVLATHQVDLVLDVGANVGQFGRKIRKAGYCGRIVSFEPQSTAWTELVETTKSDALWEVAPRAAIGAEEGDIEMHISGNSVSSSILDLMEVCTNAAPTAAYVKTERVPLRRLDAIAAPFIRPDSRVFIKVDVQGYEQEVIKGAPELLQRAVGAHLELSFVPLYAGQALFDEVTAQMKELGFEMWDFNPGFYDPRCGRILQGDGTFYRN